MQIHRLRPLQIADLALPELVRTSEPAFADHTTRASHPATGRPLPRPLMTLVLSAAVLTGCSGAAETPPTQSPTSGWVSSGSTSAGSATSGSASGPPAASSSGGSGLGDHPVEETFKAKADAACNTWFGYIVNHQPPVEMSNLLAIRASDLPAAGKYLDTLPVNHDVTKTMSALGTPTQGAGSWAALLQAFQAFEAAQAAAIAAAKAADPAAWTASVTAAESTRDTVMNDLSDAGFHGSKDACRLVFSQSSSHGG